MLGRWRWRVAAQRTKRGTAALAWRRLVSRALGDGEEDGKGHKKTIKHKLFSHNGQQGEDWSRWLLRHADAKIHT